MSSNDGIQMTFRLTNDLYTACKKSADDNGQTFAEWIRRAMKEKLERTTAAPNQQNNETLTKSDIERMVKNMIQEELGSGAVFTFTPSKKVQKQNL